MCELVRSPILTGSPTLMWKVGLEACSTLTLGRWPLWLLLGRAASTGGGTRGPLDPAFKSSSSSSSSMRCGSAGRRDWACCGGIVVRITSCSFCGGAGGLASAAPASSSLEALSGPRGSSTASRRVGWATRRRGPREGRAAEGEDMLPVCAVFDEVPVAGGASPCEAAWFESAHGDSSTSMMRLVRPRRIGLRQGRVLLVEGKKSVGDARVVAERWQAPSSESINVSGGRSPGGLA